MRQDVDNDGSRNLGEFFVVRKYRRRGVATAAARLLFSRYPGVWTLTFDHDNPGAAAFWLALIELVAESGTTTFSPLNAKSRVRFSVP
ncbi:hypothetical protein [Amycolatopsis minnesotensis]|uniref:GNAT family N-acetyltransferase n=1 Tax=Amycolatopsis minnesotensis TaxID=337894 RepID=A0ABP5BG43_9PSEU